ncbi:MAG: membrane protein insertase YidC [Zoogloeaceae bacterium]|jgi:YidC/Oxa1 family membrane protein insertase|nr:membrane protein insertase YidC [Zoogloeaceae bacterium]
MDTRRLMLFLVFALSLFMLWDAWQNQQHPQQPSPVPATASAPARTTAAVTTNDASIPQPGRRATSTGPLEVGAVDPDAPPVESVFVTTDLVKAEISALGGDLVWLELGRFRANDDKEKLFTLFSDAHGYAAQTGLIGEGLPNHKTLLKPLPGPRELAEGEDTLQVRLAAPEVNGVRATKVYTFHRASYLVDVAWEIENDSGAPLQTDAYFQLQRDGASPGGDSFMLSTFYGAAVYSDAEKYQKVAYKDIAEEKAKFIKQANDGWLALVQHYFVTAWAPQGDAPREFYMKKLGNGDVEHSLFTAGIILPVDPIASGAKGAISVPLFAGPQEQTTLKAVAPGLNLVVDYGWLHIIAAPIFWVLEFINKLVGNWGWSIVALTVLIKILFFPLSAASYKSMARMRTMTPKLMQLKERYADDKARLNQEMMKLYQTEKINPLGGCLPILVQIPVFIALYWVLLGAVEMRDAPWILWIDDLSAADPYYVLPVIMMASMFIQTRLNPTPPDPIQAKMMLFMPLVFGIMFFFFPAGLVLYWVVNNVLSIAQQWQINRLLGKESKPGSDKPKAANDPKA